MYTKESAINNGKPIAWARRGIWFGKKDKQNIKLEILIIMMKVKLKIRKNKFHCEIWK
jgi:hypothetical protein